MSRLLYNLATTLMLPLAVLHLWLRSRRQPEYLQHLGERFARYPRVDDERHNSFPSMVRQAHHERKQELAVRPETPTAAQVMEHCAAWL